VADHTVATGGTTLNVPGPTDDGTIRRRPFSRSENAEELLSNWGSQMEVEYAGAPRRSDTMVSDDELERHVNRVETRRSYRSPDVPTVGTTDGTLEERVDEMQAAARVDDLAERMAAIEERLATIEEQLAD
jgi:hypothetical protein